MNSQDFILDQLSDAQLVELIEHHNRHYWDRGDREIPDYRYDELVRELERRQPDHPLLRQLYDLKVSSLGKVIHSQPMLSLDKAYSLEEVLEWAKKHARTPDEALLVEPKYDGLSAVFDGKILATRGDGVAGENISDKLPLIRLESPNGPAPLSRPVRGEILVRNDKFDALKQKIQSVSGQQYKNSRNILAGLLRLVNSRDIAQVELGMKQADAYLSLVDYNFISHRVNLDELEGAWPELLNEMEHLPFPLDGIVVKLADETYARSLGNTAHHPRGEIAFKFTNIRRDTELLAVEWSFGKNFLTPVAILKPVDVNGITIKRASLHNVQNIIDRDIEIGDHVVVERAGDVIPYIVESTPGEHRRTALIDHCPDPRCHTPLIRQGPELLCPNPACPGMLLQRLTAAVRSIGIENLGEPTIKQMMEHLQVKSLTDIFNLTITDLMRLEGFSDKKSRNLLHSIQTARKVNDYQLLAALNIPNIGVNVARDLLKHHPLAELRKLTVEELQAIHGMGPERAAALNRELAAQAGFLDELLSQVKLLESFGAAERPTVCFTGKMPQKRDYYASIAEAHGFRVTDDVNAKLTLLVAADPESGSTKLKQAARLEVKIMALDDFLAAWPPPAGAEAPAAEPEQLDFGF